MTLTPPPIDMPRAATATECCVLECQSTVHDVSSLENGRSIGDWASVSYNQLVMLGANMMTYLKCEAQRRSISIEEAYQEELHYQQLVRQGAFSREELQILVETSTSDERLSEDDEESPF